MIPGGTDVDLAAERARAEARNAQQIRASRARRLFAEVGYEADRTALEEKMATGWPKLDQAEARATVELAMTLATDPNRKGRRLTGDELEEAKQMAKGSDEALSNDDALEIARRRMEAEPDTTGMDLYRELKRSGYNRTSANFYSRIWPHVKPAENGNEAPPKKKAPKKPAAPTTKPEAPEPAPKPERTPPEAAVEPKKPRAWNEGDIEVVSVTAAQSSAGKSRVVLELSGPAHLINHLGELVACVRAAA